LCGGPTEGTFFSSKRKLERTLIRVLSAYWDGQTSSIHSSTPPDNECELLLLEGEAELVHRAGQFDTSFVVTMIIDNRDIDITDGGCVYVDKVFKVLEVAVDVNVEVAAILAE
jgi:hypothetical protein